MNASEYLTAERSQPWREELRKSVKAAERTRRERVRMPEQDALTRVTNQLEVNRGLDEEQAVAEASRCLDCAAPTCISGCPVNVNIPKFIKYIEGRRFLEAARCLKETNALPAVCGRVCPQEEQCEAKCFYTLKLKKPPVAIGNLERFAADYERESGNISAPEVAASNHTKVAVVGSGPAGLAAAGDLARQGYEVTVFEALHEIGGVLKYGIPEFRLPNAIVDVEIENLRKMGVRFVTSFIAGKTCRFDDLRAEGYKAFFVGSGAGLPNFMNIPGENHTGVLSSNEYLTRINLMGAARAGFDTPVPAGTNVAVIGGGNTAMDSVRTAKRMGAQRAVIVYRRSMDEMPARREEIHHAQQEGIEFLCLNSPVEYLADGKGRVTHVRVQKMTLGDPDASGRRRPIPVKGSEYLMEADLVVVSVGVSPNPLIAKALPSLEVSSRGALTVNRDNMQTTIPDIFAGGDIVRGGATVILAMGDGRKAAAGIHRYLTGFA
ncbi:MAG: NADPH-dependent glutamate synthase [Bacteroidales bacterium]|jgi:glutamate synthase (NADPH/NADH) small chain|nr:NADPH-dependent glutamate synthase [Bacteroidales bacterium]